MSKDKYSSVFSPQMEAIVPPIVYSLRACARLGFVHGPTQSGLAIRFTYPPSGTNSKITTVPELREFRRLTKIICTFKVYLTSTQDNSDLLLCLFGSTCLPRELISK